MNSLLNPATHTLLGQAKKGRGQARLNVATFQAEKNFSDTSGSKESQIILHDIAPHITVDSASWFPNESGYEHLYLLRNQQH